MRKKIIQYSIVIIPIALLLFAGLNSVHVASAQDITNTPVPTEDGDATPEPTPTATATPEYYLSDVVGSIGPYEGGQYTSSGPLLLAEDYELEDDVVGAVFWFFSYYEEAGFNYGFKPFLRTTGQTLGSSSARLVETRVHTATPSMMAITLRLAKRSATP